MIDELPLSDFNICQAWVFTETFATVPYQIPGYYSFHALATSQVAGRPMGGVSILVAPLPILPILHETGDNFVIVRVMGVFLVGTYIRPNTSINEMIDILAGILSLIPDGAQVILAGDFNARIDLPIHPPKTLAFMNFLNERGLRICSHPTPKTFEAVQGSSTIDLITTNLPLGSVSTPCIVEGHTIQLRRRHLPVNAMITMGPPPPYKYRRPD
jgi:hypothetical protein